MTETMQAVEIARPGGPEVLVPTTRPRPEARAGEVVTLTAEDLNFRLQLYPPPVHSFRLNFLDELKNIPCLCLSTVHNKIVMLKRYLCLPHPPALHSQFINKLPRPDTVGILENTSCTGSEGLTLATVSPGFFHFLPNFLARGRTSLKDRLQSVVMM